MALLHYNQSIKDPVTQFHERLEEHDAYLTRKPGVSRTGEEEEQITPADVIQHNQLAYADVGKMGMFRSQEYEEEAYYESYEKELVSFKEHIFLNVCLTEFAPSWKIARRLESVTIIS